MTTFDKLIIKGFRSFGFEDTGEQEIVFSSPLTLIHGNNGSGKTAVVEALRYALCGKTGDKPGGKAGAAHSFIHDLGRNGSKEEVIAQISLSKRGEDEDQGEEEEALSAVRKIEFRQDKSNKYSGEHTLNGVTVPYNGVDGQKKLNSELSKFIGMSPGLLDVVSCHQNDSCWLIDLDSELKKKFDKIFNLEYLEKDIIETMAQINKEEKSLKDLVIKKDEAFVTKKEAEGKSKILEEGTIEIEKREREIKVQNDELKTIEEKIELFKPSVVELMEKRTEERIVSERIQRNSRDIENLKEFTNLYNDDEELHEVKRRKLNDPNQSFIDSYDSTQNLKEDAEESMRKIDEELLKANSDLAKKEVYLVIKTKEEADTLTKIEGITKKVEESCGDREFETVLGDQKEKTENLMLQSSNLEAKNVLFATFINQIEEKSCCPLCQTKLNLDRKIESLKGIKEELRTLPSQLVENEENLKLARIKYDELIRMKSSIEEQREHEIKVKNIQAEIMRTKSEKEEKELTIAALKRDKASVGFQRLNYLSSDHEKDQDTLQQLLSDIEVLSQSCEENKKLENQKKVLSEKIIRNLSQQEILKRVASGEKKALNEDCYKNASDIHRKICREVEELQESIEKLKTLRDELDDKQRQRHKDNLTKVNERILQLWREFYRDDDIQSIRIYCDNDKKTNDVYKNREYDYCVMQTVNGRETEMRGRCSWGQKFFACLIVRFALASVFNCPAIVIDEPTAHLDTQNINSLSNTINKIAREIADSKKTFQIIVMSHSMEFLRKLDQKEYYSLTRNREGKSTIKRWSSRACMRLETID